MLGTRLSLRRGLARDQAVRRLGKLLIRRDAAFVPLARERSRPIIRFSRKPYIGEDQFRRSFADLRSIVIYSELKKFQTIEMKSDKKEHNSKECDSISNVRPPPIKSFGRNWIRQSNW